MNSKALGTRKQFQALRSCVTSTCILLLSLAISVTARAQTDFTFEKLYAFGPGPSGPYTPLLQARDGNLYGAADDGIFSISPEGAFTVLCSFSGTNGAFASGRLLQAENGNFYGTTSQGGISDYGTVFQLTTNGLLTTLASFFSTNGARPLGGLCRGNDDNFYGTTGYGGRYNLGTVFKINPAGAISTLFSFDRTNGANPSGDLILGPDGIFYGTALNGGARDYGTVFQITAGGAVSTLATFFGTNGAHPSAGLLMGRDGGFYGTARAGGRFYRGNLFRITMDGELTTLMDFDWTNGASPSGILIYDRTNNIYGTTSIGGTDQPGVGSGTIFRFSSDGEFTTVAYFTNSSSSPSAGVTLANDGFLYGSSPSGGINGGGSIVRCSTTGDLFPIVSFPWANGERPVGDLAEGPDGWYGTTSGNLVGHTDYGTVFKLMTNGLLTSLFRFMGTNGALPQGLTLSHNGTFYGATSEGGLGYGTIFNIDRSGRLTTLCTFDGFNGAYPEGPPVEASDGNFYGTTAAGGLYFTAPDGFHEGFGTLYRLTPEGVLTSLFSFDRAVGAYPGAQLVKAPNGAFYGITQDQGTIFSIRTNGEFHTLAAFTPLLYAYPQNLTQGSDGNFYGITSETFAPLGAGTVFKITPAGTMSPIAILDPAHAGPPQWVMQASDANFYGTTQSGGATNSGSGSVFRIDADNGSVTNLVVFDGPNGMTPQGNLVQGSDGALYGMTSNGGVNTDFFQSGTIFKITGKSLSLPLKPSILVTPNPVDFGSLTIRQSSEATFTIVNEGSAESVLTGTVQQPNNNYFTIISSPLSFSLHGAEAVTFTVRVKPGANPAIYESQIDAALIVDSNDPLNPSLEIPLTVFVKGPAPTSFSKSGTCTGYLSDVLEAQLSWTSTSGVLSDLNGVVIRELLLPTVGWLPGSDQCNCVQAPAPWVITKPASWTEGPKTWNGDERTISFCSMYPLPGDDPEFGGGLEWHGTYPYQLPYVENSFQIEQVYQWNAPWHPDWADLLQDTITRRIYRNSLLWRYECSSLFAGSVHATLGFSFIRKFALSPGASGNTVSINFEGVPGSNYGVQRATSPNGPWSTIATLSASSPGDGSIDFNDTNAPLDQSFYRIIQY